MTARNREAVQIVNEAAAKGWRVRRGGHGTVLRCPGECRCQISVATTPGSARYLANTIAALRRCRSWEKAQ